MTNDQPIAIKDAVQKLQLSLLEGVKDQNQLFAAGYLMARGDYEDVVTERTIANLCGYPLCKNALPLTPLRRGRYRISLKEHKVFDLQETSKFCSSDCLINSRSFMGTLQEERSSVLDTVKLNEILSSFHESSVLDSFGLSDELRLSRLRIYENEEPKNVEVSLEEWMGPYDAIEGYVPKNVSKPKNVGKPKGLRSKNCDQGFTPIQDKPNSSNEMDFRNNVTTCDKHSVSGIRPPVTEATKSLKSEQPHGDEGSNNLKKGATVPRSSFGSSKNYSGSVASDKPSIKNSIFNEMDFFSTIITSDEYTSSKLPPHSMEPTLKEEPVDVEGSKSFDLEQQNVVIGSSSPSFKRPMHKKSEEAKGKHKIVEQEKSYMQEVPPTPFHCATTTEAAESDKKSHAEKACLLNESVLKPSLKSSHAKKLGRSVTWADDNAASIGSRNLCEFRVIQDTKTGLEPSCKKDDGDCTLRYASAEACASALSHAAEAVSSQHLDASDKSSIKNSILNEMNFSTIITSDEYAISKLPPHPAEPTLKEEPVDVEGSKSLDLEQQIVVTGSSSPSFSRPLHKKSEEAQGKHRIVDKDKSNMQGVPPTPFHCGTTAEAAESDKKSHVEKACLLNESFLKPSLKSSHAKKLGRSVTWGDENVASSVSNNLCEFRVIQDTKSGPEPSCKKYDGDHTIRYASAEACALALSQAAEAVATQHLDVTDAVSEAGVVILPTALQGSEEECMEDVEEECMEDVEEEAVESEPTRKWPTKPGHPDSDIFDPDQSWFDKAPEGFSLTLSNFATLWNAIFGWVTSCSLAYVYGKDEASHEEYLFVNGREYPRKIFLEDGRSSEIKVTLAGYLARALPGLITDLRLPVPTSELERGLACLLDTMSFVEAIPAIRMKQWKVIVLLFLEALSVARIPAVATYINNRRMLLHVVLDGAELAMEEYEMMKDILMPLGRIPQFSSQSGA